MLDFSTINLEKLKKLPVHSIPTSYYYGDGIGSGCFLDAPGYPSYFLKGVYTSHGNSPHKGAQTVIQFENVSYVVETADGWYVKSGRTGDRDISLRYLWKPLPIDSLHVQLWMRYTYTYLHSCYRVVEGDKTIDTPLKWPEKRPVGWFTENQIPENHRAYLHIKEFYSEHTPNLAYIKEYPKGHTPDWWEREAEWPVKCIPGGGRYHPFNTTWCQWCGWNIGSEILNEDKFKFLENQRLLLEGK